jgi:hypothetical protein
MYIMKRSRQHNASRRQKKRSGGNGGASGFGVKMFGFDQQAISPNNNMVKTIGGKLFSRFFGRKNRHTQKKRR